MSCSLHSPELPKPKPVRVNGRELSRAEISLEAQYFPASKPLDAWKEAARALVIRQLLLEEADRLAISAEPKTEDGRTETGDEARIRQLLERCVVTPEPDKAACLQYYKSNHTRLRATTIYEAAHILVAANQRDVTAYRIAQEKIGKIAAVLRQFPEKFDMLAAVHSDCPSAEHHGNLGQLTAGQTTPEFEKALFALAQGSISDPVQSRYGLHIIRLDQKIEGKLLPFEQVQYHIADYLRESVQRRAVTQYIALLVSRARVEGIELAGAEAHRVN